MFFFFFFIQESKHPLVVYFVEYLPGASFLIGFGWYTGLPWWLRQWRIHLQCRKPGFDPWVDRLEVTLKEKKKKNYLQYLPRIIDLRQLPHGFLETQARVRFYVSRLAFLSYCGIGDTVDPVISSLSQIWLLWDALFLPVSHVHALMQSRGLSFLSPYSPLQVGRSYQLPVSCCDSGWGPWVWTFSLPLFLDIEFNST